MVINPSISIVYHVLTRKNDFRIQCVVLKWSIFSRYVILRMNFPRNKSFHSNLLKNFHWTDENQHQRVDPWVFKKPDRIEPFLSIAPVCVYMYAVSNKSIIHTGWKSIPKELLSHLYSYKIEWIAKLLIIWENVVIKKWKLI